MTFISSQVSTHLLATLKEELVRLHAIADRAAYHRHPMKDHRRLMRVLEKQLVEDIEDDGEDNECGECGENDCDGGRRGREARDRDGNDCEEAHIVCWGPESE